MKSFFFFFLTSGQLLLFLFFLKRFIYIFAVMVFVAVLRLSLVLASWGYSALR